MFTSSLSPKLVQLLNDAEAVITYQPFADEPDLAPVLLRASPSAEIIQLTQDRSADPFMLAERIKNSLRKKSVVALIPGRTFDRFGTRHGRGGGWYDRLLSAVPAHWVRIGVAKKERLSHSALHRQPWDEPVDWILLQDKGTWTFFKTPPQTARRAKEPSPQS